MNIIFIYGAPAVGKLSVAQELAKITGYKILHLHLTIDLVASLFERFSAPYSKLNRKIRLQLIEAAAQEQLPGLIFTYGNSSPSAQEFIQDVINLAKNYQSNVYFVYLTCSSEELLKRVVNASRKKYGKITSTKILKQTLAERQFLMITSVDNLVIDNTQISAEIVAQQIKQYYQL